MISSREIQIRVQFGNSGSSLYTAYNSSAVTDLIIAITSSQAKLHINISLHANTNGEFKFMAMCLEGGCVLRPILDDGIVGRGEFFARPTGFSDGDKFTIPFIVYQEPFQYEIFSFPRECILSMDDAMKRLARYIQDGTMGSDVVRVPTDDASTGISSQEMIEGSPYVIDTEATM